jgi:transcriptional regulator with XRE-family HTH domain
VVLSYALLVSSALLLRTARLEAGLTQAQLAGRLGLTQPAVAKLERADANPTVATLDRALRATGRRLALVSDPPDVDETQIVERLRLSPAERLAAFQSSQRKLARLVQGARRAGPASR